MKFPKPIPLKKIFFFLSLLGLLTHINTSYANTSSINNTKATAQSFSQDQVDQAVIKQLKFIESGGAKPAEIVIVATEEATNTTSEKVTITTTEEPAEEEPTQELVEPIEVESKKVITVNQPEPEKPGAIDKALDETSLIASISTDEITNVLPKELEQVAMDLMNAPEFIPKAAPSKPAPKEKKSAKRKIVALETTDNKLEMEEEEKENTTSNSKKKRRLVKVSNITKAETPESPLKKAVLKTENRAMEVNRGRNQLTSPGWIYLGKFENDVWDDNTLSIENQLPEVGKQYLVSATSVNVRTSSNRKDKGNKIFHWLKKGAEVTILQLKRSGRSKHYWAEVITQTSASE